MIVGKPHWNRFEDNEEYRQAWADFIREFKWDWFISLTFANIVHENIGEKMFARLISRINKRAFGRRYYHRSQSVYWMRGKENHKHRTMYHFHALLGGLPLGNLLDCPEEMADWWEGKGYGTAVIRQYSPHRGAAYYIAKYVGHGGEMDLGGHFPVRRQEPYEERFVPRELRRKPTR